MNARLATWEADIGERTPEGSGEVGLPGFRALVHESSPALFRLAARLLGSLQDAEDAVQEGHLKAFQAMRRGDFEARSQPKTWLYRIVTNTALEMLRRKKDAPGASQTSPSGLSALHVDGESRATALVQLRELSEFLDTLTDEQRAAFVLKEMEGLTGAEVAEVLQCSEGAVEQRLVRARSLLKARFHDE
jgi:RNA polymerase sigma-70 factor (ECF subfamily)